MYVFGGFSGLLLNDVLSYTPPSCRAYSSPSACLAAGPGVRCLWVESRCLPWESKQHDPIVPAPFCPAPPGRPRRHLKQLTASVLFPKMEDPAIQDELRSQKTNCFMMTVIMLKAFDFQLCLQNVIKQTAGQQCSN